MLKKQVILFLCLFFMTVNCNAQEQQGEDASSQESVTTMLIALSAQPSIASHPTQLQDPPDIVILNWSWKEFPRLRAHNPSDEVPQNPYTRSRDPFGPKDTLEAARQRESVKVESAPERNRSVKRHQYTVEIKNTGAKTIKGLIWNYLFVHPGNEERSERYEFRTKKKIKPGQKQQITEVSFAPPHWAVDISSFNKTERMLFGEQVIITRIEYVDGSVWGLGSN